MFIFHLRTRHVVLFCVVVLTGCLQGAESAQRPAAPIAPAIPWQPQGLRAPTVQCELEVPPGLVRSASPMKDHIAEFSSAAFPPKTTAILSERVEPALKAARERVLRYYRTGLLKSKGALTTTDSPLSGAKAPGHLISVRWGTPSEGHVETVALLAFVGQPIVEVLARHDEGDEGARDAVMALVRSVRCMTDRTRTRGRK